MKRNSLNILLFVQAFFVCTTLSAQVPDGYYNTIDGDQKITLKTALHEVIKDHTKLTYGELWTAFEDTDAKPDGSVWDMYSDCSFTFVEDQDRGSGGTSECQYFNREHSFPKSWFDDEEPMYTDLFHLYPTDKYVNNQRGNLPFGETGNPVKTYGNGSKRGYSTSPGYTKEIFEPADQYKGDFARTYFYMVTCYEDKVADWNSTYATESLAGNAYPAFKQWAIDVLLKWHRNDPVSKKEIDRNNMIYTSYQHNRNPYIDRPELAEYIWGNKMNEVYYLSDPSGICNEAELQSVEISASEGAIVMESVRPVQHLYIYDIFGRLVYSGAGDVGLNRIEVAGGQFYIVKAGETIVKVYVE